MKPTSRKKPRRMARRALLQVLYEVDISGHSIKDSLIWVTEEFSLDEQSVNFIRTSANNIMNNQFLLDTQIQLFAKNWPISQLPVVDRGILRIAFYEILTPGETPPKVAINEAVELAKRFGSENLPRFVNGVLGKFLQTTIIDKP
jgi:N utilization substance protein B